MKPLCNIYLMNNRKRDHLKNLIIVVDLIKPNYNIDFRYEFALRII